MYLLVAHATLASCDCPLRKLDAMPVLSPLPPTQATPRVGSSSSCHSVRLKPDDRPPTQARGSVVSVFPAAARLGANQTGGWSG